jgi:hypothetical protein
MKGEVMKHHSAATRMGLVTAALVFLFTLAAISPAEAKLFNLKSQLRKSGVSMKIVSLDRTDGFVYGISFTGPKNTFVIAPGLAGMWLVQAEGNEVTLQRDALGQVQIIQSDGDISVIFCYIQAVNTFLYDLTQCESDPACVFTAILEVVTNILYCNNVATPTY